MKCNRKILVKISLCLMLWSTAAAQTPIADHWSPYDYPKQIPEGVQFHIVVDGDTLWGIAQQYFQNPFLWPQIYQANTYIQDPDLIYPGDPIVLDIGVVVTDQAIADALGEDGQEGGELAELTEFAEGGGEDAQVSDRSQTTSMIGSGTELVILPAGDRTDMECSTYIFPVDDDDYELPFTLFVMGGEIQGKLTYANDDVIYLNKGAEDGIKSGDEMSVRREKGVVREPESGDVVGVAIDQIAKIRVIAVQDRSATAMIIDSCDAVMVSDFLVPYEQEPIPLITQLPPFDRWAPFMKDDYGFIVYAEDQNLTMGKGSLVNVNVGILDNVAPGDVFIIYRPNPNKHADKGETLPDIYLGQGVALKSSEKTTVMKIIQGIDVIKVGDRVTLYQN
ncbi:MAG: LysM peptidoglycan-binding domain-containing protein [Acidobacteria bacterium]|nr:LysM peptidoglycan-binding domain-containing protein [Acidobacteriota bacterium]